jgi:hypothetical protein
MTGRRTGAETGAVTGSGTGIETGRGTGTGMTGTGTGPRMRGLPLLAADLDRTLIYSAAALGLDGVPDSEAPRLLCVEVYEGRPLSFMTETAARLLAETTGATEKAGEPGQPAQTGETGDSGGPARRPPDGERCVFVPATTRTPEQYRRVRLPGGPPRYAVCANGGHLLVDGESDPEWREQVRGRLADCAPLDDVRERLRTSSADGDWVLKRRVADGLFAYLVVDRERLPTAWVKELAAWAEPRGWTVSLQGRKLYAVPGSLTKSAAVAEVARRTGATRIHAAGDSLLDADMLLAADGGWIPGHGELADSGWSAAHITALAERGVAAGERIVRAMHGTATAA